MVVFPVRTPLLFGAVSEAEIHALMIAFGHGHPCWHIGRLQLGIDRLDVRELEELQSVQAAL